MNTHAEQQAVRKSRGIEPIPDEHTGIGSFAEDYAGIRPDPKSPGFFLHGADPDSPTDGVPGAGTRALEEAAKKKS